MGDLGKFDIRPFAKSGVAFQVCRIIAMAGEDGPQ